MKQIFNYKAKFAVSYFYPAMAFIILAVLCQVFEYGIALRNLRLLAYPNSVYVMSVLAVLFLVYAFMTLSKYLQSKKNPNMLEIDDIGISFPRGASEKITVSFSDMTGFSTGHDEDTGREITVRTKDRSYTFKEDNFDNESDYASFSKSVQDRYNIKNA